MQVRAVLEANEAIDRLNIGSRLMSKTIHVLSRNVSEQKTTTRFCLHRTLRYVFSAR